MAEENVKPNAHEFDCRRYIVPGDYVDYGSMKACDEAQQIDRRVSPVPCHTEVKAVYAAFVVVRLKKVTECVNRWDIQKINGTPVGNAVGYFGKA